LLLHTSAVEAWMNRRDKIKDDLLPENKAMFYISIKKFKQILQDYIHIFVHQIPKK
jgi:hypothetical protein